MGKIFSVGIGAIMAVFSIIVVVDFVAAVDTSGWPTIVATIAGTFMPMILGIGGLIVILRGLGVMGEGD